MSAIKTVWALERRCWLEGRSYYKEILADDALYAFPPPMGLFRGNQFVDQMGEDGPCVSVEMTMKHDQLRDGVAVLAYHGAGTGPDGGLRMSHCTSVWREAADGWKLACHHQTPLTE